MRRREDGSYLIGHLPSQKWWSGDFRPRPGRALPRLQAGTGCEPEPTRTPGLLRGFSFDGLFSRATIRFRSSCFLALGQEDSVALNRAAIKIAFTLKKTSVLHPYKDIVEILRFDP